MEMGEQGLFPAFSEGSYWSSAKQVWNFRERNDWPR